jgi:hypothetical protein
VRHDNIRTLARYAALDRDAAVSGSPAGTDVATLINDHVTTLAAMRNDRATTYTSTAGTFSVAAGAFSARIGATNILRILNVTRESTNASIDGTPLDIVSPADIYHLRSKSVVAGVVQCVAFVRLAGSNRFRALVHPPALATTYLSIGYWPFERELTISPLDDTEVLDLPQHAAYQVVRETAIDIACILRREPPLIDSIHSRVPQAEALGAGMLARNMGPNAPIDEPR